jgi:hypothetical protein
MKKRTLAGIPPDYGVYQLGFFCYRVDKVKRLQYKHEVGYKRAAEYQIKAIYIS